MNSRSSDADWELFAKQDPYWAVLTDDKFRRQNLNQEARDDFFASGEGYVNRVFEMVRRHLDPDFAPRTALDFGCGVGRLAIPMGAKFESVVGVDVSETMLREAQAACESRGIKNVRLVQGLDKLSSSERKFDFINSYIVFQHIPCHRGLDLFRQLVGLLAEDGVGAIHFTFSKSSYSGDVNGSLPVEYKAQVQIVHTHPDGLRYHLGGAKRAAWRLLKEKILKRPPPAQPAKQSPQVGEKPVMQMNPYLLNPILQVLQLSGVRRFHAAFSDHGGELGLILFFKKQPAQPYSF
jgi:SAM-dependent methyltransferase